MRDFMEEWLVNSIIALVFWGLWNFFPKLATMKTNVESVYVSGSLGVAIVTLVLAILWKSSLKLDSGTLPGLLGGVFGAAGSVFFLLAISKGPFPIVSTITALYPAVAVLLSIFFLGEVLSAKQIVGIVFALFGVGMMVG